MRSNLRDIHCGNSGAREVVAPGRGRVETDRQEDKQDTIRQRQKRDRGDRQTNRIILDRHRRKLDRETFRQTDKQDNIRQTQA